MREPGLEQLLMAALEQVSAEVGVERGGVEAGRLERDDGTVDAPTRLAVGKGEEMRPAFLEEELECHAPQQIATWHQLPHQR